MAKQSRITTRDRLGTQNLTKLRPNLDYITYLEASADSKACNHNRSYKWFFPMHKCHNVSNDKILPYFYPLQKASASHPCMKGYIFWHRDLPA